MSRNSLGRVTERIVLVVIDMSGSYWGQFDSLLPGTLYTKHKEEIFLKVLRYFSPKIFRFCHPRKKGFNSIKLISLLTSIYSKSPFTFLIPG